jgi:hypothetical protein
MAINNTLNKLELTTDAIIEIRLALKDRIKEFHENATRSGNMLGSTRQGWLDRKHDVIRAYDEMKQQTWE